MNKHLETVIDEWNKKFVHMQAKKVTTWGRIELPNIDGVIYAFRCDNMDEIRMRLRCVPSKKLYHATALKKLEEINVINERKFCHYIDPKNYWTMETKMPRENVRDIIDTMEMFIGQTKDKFK